MSMRAEGDDFYVAQGEDFDALFSVNDGATPPVAYDLTGGAAAFTYWQGSGTASSGNCGTPTTTVAVTIARATIKTLSGDYNYEFWCRNAANTVRMTKKGVIHVETTKTPDAVAPA